MQDRSRATWNKNCLVDDPLHGTHVHQHIHQLLTVLALKVIQHPTVLDLG